MRRILALAIGTLVVFIAMRLVRNNLPRAQFVDEPDPACPFPEWRSGPVSPYESCVPSILSDTTFRWREVRSPHFAIHYTDSTEVARDPSRFVDRAESALTDNLALLGLREYQPTIHLFYVTSRDELKRLTGGSGVGWTVANAQMIVLVDPPGTTETDERHEIMHVLSLNAWGYNPISAYWIREGLGVFSTERCAPGAIDSTARAMFADGRAKPLATYREAFFVTGVDNYPAYMLSGSFVKFLYETGGRERLQQAWDGDVATLERVYQKSADSLEAEWKQHLKVTSHPAVRAGCG